jgi:hypothetical protein
MSRKIQKDERDELYFACGVTLAVVIALIITYVRVWA